MKVGAQFYTLRDHCKNLEDFAESLKRVADIGYTTVQISGVCPYEPQWLKEQLDQNGLKCVLTHIPGDRMLADPVQVAKDHDVFGCDTIGLGSYGFSPERGQSVQTFARDFTPVIQSFEACGKRFSYHNHAHEFEKRDGRLILDQIAEAVPQLCFTLDTYWVQVGGGDPAQWLEKLSGRIPCIHLKDYSYGAKMAPIGEGNINFDRVFEKAAAGGTQYMLVEQDDCNGEDPFDCLARSYAFLKANGFE